MVDVIEDFPSALVSLVRDCFSPGDAPPESADFHLSLSAAEGPPAPAFSNHAGHRYHAGDHRIHPGIHDCPKEALNPLNRADIRTLPRTACFAYTKDANHNAPRYRG